MKLAEFHLHMENWNLCTLFEIPFVFFSAIMQVMSYFVENLTKHEKNESCTGKEMPCNS